MSESEASSVAWVREADFGNMQVWECGRKCTVDVAYMTLVKKDGHVFL